VLHGGGKASNTMATHTQTHAHARTHTRTHAHTHMCARTSARAVRPSCPRLRRERERELSERDAAVLDRGDLYRSLLSKHRVAKEVRRLGALWARSELSAAAPGVQKRGAGLWVWVPWVWEVSAR